ncbi:hypothetical protein EVAR_48238_1 [Eumeta japonica]|uniref:Uncharacterized protein n=1 Tax=Eumeta variegata TaxID=151549 RepID=A0A4C1YDS9_EUMVA|nr:hypothetical protein EVAR_48238_1 [Eumeta japonica]
MKKKLLFPTYHQRAAVYGPDTQVSTSPATLDSVPGELDQPGIMKQFVKAFVKQGEYFEYLCEQFSGLSEAKLKEDVFVETDLRKLLRDGNFVTKIKEKEKAAYTKYEKHSTVLLVSAQCSAPQTDALAAKLAPAHFYAVGPCPRSVSSNRQRF